VRNIAKWPRRSRRDLSRKITVDVRAKSFSEGNAEHDGRDQLKPLAGEVTRVAREVGTKAGWAARPSAGVRRHLARI